MSQHSDAEYISLLKLFATVIRKLGGTVELDAQDMYNSEPPLGFQKRWNNESKKLVIELIEHGTALFLTDNGEIKREEREGVDKWPLIPQSQQVQQAQQAQQLPQEIAAAIAREHQQLDLDHRNLRKQPASTVVTMPAAAAAPAAQPRHLILDNERQQHLERSREAAAAMRAILEFQQPEPAPMSSQRLVNQSPLPSSSQTPQQVEQVSHSLPQSYFRT